MIEELQPLKLRASLKSKAIIKKPLQKRWRLYPSVSAFHTHHSKSPRRSIGTEIGCNSLQSQWEAILMISKMECKSQLCGALNIFCCWFLCSERVGGECIEGMQHPSNGQTSSRQWFLPLPRLWFSFLISSFRFILVTVLYLLAPWSYCWVSHGGGPKPHSSKGLTTAGGRSRDEGGLLMNSAGCSLPGSPSREGEAKHWGGCLLVHTRPNKKDFLNTGSAGTAGSPKLWVNPPPNIHYSFDWFS